MKKWIVVGLLTVLLLLLKINASQAGADVRYEFTNDTPWPVRAQVFEQPNPHEMPTNYWPAEGESWLIAPGEKFIQTISATKFENICFGAVVDKNPSRSWGIWSQRPRGSCTDAVHGRVVRVTFTRNNHTPVAGDGCDTAWGMTC